MYNNHRQRRRLSGRTTGVLVVAAVLLVGGLAIVGPLSLQAKAATAAPSVSSDAKATFSPGGVLSWTHNPSLSASDAPTLVTLACAAVGSVSFTAWYGGEWMTTAVAYQYNGLSMYMFYLNYPPPGSQVVWAMASAGSGTNEVECSATTWTGTVGVDMSIATTNYEWGTSQTYATISPAFTVPAGEIFFSAINRYEWSTGTTLSVSGSPSGVGASIVDSSLTNGCQQAGSSDVDCIASAKLLSGGTSMQYSWLYNGAFAVMGGFGIKAIPAVVSGWNGWYGDGNRVIYMTTGVTNGYVLPIASSSGTSSNVEWNAINAGTGETDNYTSSGIVYFHEYWIPNNNQFAIDMPIVGAAGSNIGQSCRLPGECYAQGPGYVNLSLTTSQSPYSGTNILPSYDGGRNITNSKYGVSAAPDDNAISLAFDLAGLLAPPPYDFYIGTMALMYDLTKLITPPSTGADAYTGESGNGIVWSHFYVGNWTTAQSQTVYTAMMVAEVRINGQNNGADFMASDPVFTIAATNMEGSFPEWSGPSPAYGAGAAAYTTIYAVPAVTLSGQVKNAAGVGVAGATVNIQATSGSESGTDFQVTTGSNGNYEFFAQVGTTYTVSASLSTPFGTQTTSVSCTLTNCKDASPTAMWANATLPLYEVYGTIYNSGGAALCGATATLANSVTWESAATGCDGKYILWTPATGTNTLTASQSGYQSQSQSVTVSSTQTSYGPYNFYLSPIKGGCVLAGTLVATPNGRERPVERFSEGDAVLGYNVALGTWVKESVTSNVATKVSEVLSINGGLLETTLTDQPLYVQNGTWTGWVRDPQNLSVGERLYSPWTGSWIGITSLQVLHGTFTVYDLRATGPNDYIANGVLADMKH